MAPIRMVMLSSSGGKERRERLERGIGIDDTHELRQEVAEEAAGQRAHEERTDAAGEHEAEHLPACSLRRDFFVMMMEARIIRSP